MIITATDFQLRVNEYFTKLMKGEEIIIERYGKNFAVLVPYDEYQKMVGGDQNEKGSSQHVAASDEVPSKTKVGGSLDSGEVLKLLKKLLND
ncbi:MAG: type II toxin-antitoxin system Phd/YefM family antitoxin [Candidatus Dojkabacteria bacterium]